MYIYVSVDVSTPEEEEEEEEEDTQLIFSFPPSETQVAGSSALFVVPGGAASASQHWFSVPCSERIGPVYILDVVTPYTSSHSLRSATANRLVPPPPRAHHYTLAPDWWNQLPTDIRTAGRLKTHI